MAREKGDWEDVKQFGQKGRTYLSVKGHPTIRERGGVQSGKNISAVVVKMGNTKKERLERLVNNTQVLGQMLLPI